MASQSAGSLATLQGGFFITENNGDLIFNNPFFEAIITLLTDFTITIVPSDLSANK